MSFTMRRVPLNRLALPVLVLTAAVGLSACGDGGDDSGSMPGMTHNSSTTTTTAPASTPTPAGTAATGAHNDSDVGFATQMIPHHRQAVVMAAMASTRAGSPQVKELAATIKAAQAPEIDQMSGWLTGWGQPLPTDAGMDGMDHGEAGGSGGHEMSGMMSEQDMQKMSSMTGTEFDVAFLTGMITHHEGAVIMAKTELSKGTNPEAKELAQAIIKSQSTEITQMSRLLAQLKK